MTLPVAQIEPHAATPLHLQIYARYKSLIAQGRMAPGERVPSLRVLAVELGVARGTVEAAYDRLIGEGYLVSRGPAGTFVADKVARSGGAAPSRQRRPTAPRAPVSSLDPMGQPEGGGPQLLQAGLPALDAFPRKLWTRLLARHARAAPAMAKPPAAGLPALREALADYLHRSRGIEADAHQIFIVPAYTAALGLVADALLRPGDTCWVESPGFPPTSHVLARLGHPLARIPLDDEGLDVAAGRARHPAARLAVVTPSHQSPTGVSMSMARRTALLDWAGEHGAWILEDDYDGEYRYRGHPLPALKSLDRGERVLYCGTLSKVLFPGLRLAYLVVPDSQVEAFRAASHRALHGGCPELYQAVAADFIREGHFARHIKRMRTLYAKRRTMLADAFAPWLGHGLSIDLRDGGMHLLIRLRDDLDDVALARRGREGGFGLQALTDWRNGEPGQRGLMVSFTNVATQAEACGLVERLMTALELPAVSAQPA